jgi:hypothetical protein
MRPFVIDHATKSSSSSSSPAARVTHVEGALDAAPPLRAAPQCPPAPSVARQARRARLPPVHGVPRLASWTLVPRLRLSLLIRLRQARLPCSPAKVWIHPDPVVHECVRLLVHAPQYRLSPLRACLHVVQQILQVVRLRLTRAGLAIPIRTPSARLPVVRVVWPPPLVPPCVGLSLATALAAARAAPMGLAAAAAGARTRAPPPPPPLRSPPPRPPPPRCRLRPWWWWW